MRPIAASSPERIVAIGGLASDATDGDYVDWWGSVAGLERLAVFHAGDAEAALQSGRQWVRVTEVSAEFFRVFGVTPSQGRDFTRADESGPLTAIVSEVFAAKHFPTGLSGDSGEVRLADVPYRVIGVVPATFTFPGSTDVWVLRTRLRQPTVALFTNVAGMPPLEMRNAAIGRLLTGVTMETVQSQLMALLAEANRIRSPRTGVLYGDIITVEPLGKTLFAKLRPMLATILTATALLLFLATWNAGIYFATEYWFKRPETLIKQALGATRSQLLREVLRRTLWISAICGASAALVARLAVPALGPALASFQLRIVNDSRITVSALAIALVIGAIAGVAVGALSLLTSGSRSIASTVRSSAVGGSIGRWIRRAAVCGSVALAFVMMAGSQMSTAALLRATNTPVGYDADFLIRASFSMPPTNASQFGPGQQEALLARASSVPGVRAAVLLSSFPVRRQDRQFLEVASADRRQMTAVTFFTGPVTEVFGLRVAGETTSRPDVLSAIVDEGLSERLGVDPGEVVRIGRNNFIVTGIVPPISTLDQDRPVPQMFLPFDARRSRTTAERGMTLVARCAMACSNEVIRDFRTMLNSEAIRVHGVALVRQEHRRATSPARATALVWTAYGTLAVFVAGIGLVALVRATTARRRSEIAIRVAVGAKRQAIAVLLAREALACAALGVSSGAFLATILYKSIAHVLGDVPPPTPEGLFAITAGCGFLALAASAIPAWLQAGQPSQTLFAER